MTTIINLLHEILGGLELNAHVFKQGIAIKGSTLHSLYLSST
jgi:hypothetical protein